MKLHGTMKINQSGHLEIGGCDVTELAKSFGTPLYVLDEDLFRENCREYYQSFTQKYKAGVIYASKTLLTLAICRIVEEEGLGLDVVSGGELYTAQKAKFPMSRVYFHGNNKSAGELKMGLEYGIGCFVVDNLNELKLLNSLAGEMKKTADIMVRVSPGIDAHTHEYIKTGKIDSKFGLAIETGQAAEGINRALQLKNLNLKGIHCHIGSQIFELESYVHAAGVMMNFAFNMYSETGWYPEELNLGGGFGIYYAKGDTPRPVSEYADMVYETVNRKVSEHKMPMPKLIVEPGRSISGPAGSTVYTVGAIKDIPGIRKYVSVNGGMGDNPRPALYRSQYEACLANKAGADNVEVVSVAGKCCESGDMLIWDVLLPAVDTGDIMVISCTGAYNYTMSMNYNRLPRPAMVLVKDGRADIIVERETYRDLIRNDVIPERLKKGKIVNIASLR